MSEKRKPTYDLEAFKQAFPKQDGVRITTVALNSAAALGLNRSGIGAIVKTMQRRHFYKSMTAYSDRRRWQDVYHVPSKLGVLYVKFTNDVLAEFLLLSFKEKDDD